MIAILPVDAVRRVEAFADSHGLSYATLMQHAGRVIAHRAQQILAMLPDPQQSRVTVLVGGGNNGGDGLVAGFLLAQSTSASVRFYLLKPRSDDDPVFAPVLQAGHLVVNAEDDADQRVLRTMVGSSQLIIDAVFGIGLTLPLRSDIRQKFREIRAALNIDYPIPPYTETAAFGTPSTIRPYVLAVDAPSGIDCGAGDADPAALPADETISFIAAKPGLLRFPAAALVGKLSLSTLGVPSTAPDLRHASDKLVDAQWLRNVIPGRPVDSNKGTYGKVLVVGGSEHYIGAPLLSAQAAYRTGSGLVTVAAPAPVAEMLAPQFLEATWKPLNHRHGNLSAEAVPELGPSLAEYDSVAIGMGIGQTEAAASFLTSLFTGRALPPTVLDADALNILAAIPEWWKLLPAESVVTPHPGEMARLTGLTAAEVQENRLSVARTSAASWSTIVLLKGAHTVIAHPDGQCRVLPFKNPVLSTAGTGDILAGIISSLLGQGMKPFDAATAGGLIHGFSGEIVAGKNATTRGALAGEFSAAIPAVFAALGV